MSTNPFDSFGSQPPDKLQSLQWPMAVGLAIVGVLLGGYLCGCVIDQFGSIGSVSIWALGGVLGWAAGKILAPNTTVGYVLATAVVLAFFVAEICWIKWNIVGVETWIDAAKKLPLFFRTYRIDSFITGLMAFFGASSAYRQAGSRYEYVRVERK